MREDDKLKYIVFGAGDYGKRVLSLIGKDSIECFVDNNPDKDGLEIGGVKIFYFANARQFMQEYPIIVAVSEEKEDDIARQLIENEFKDYIKYQDFTQQIIKRKILSRPDNIKTYLKTINWIKNNSIKNEGIIVATSIIKSYPEVTGYYIPTLFTWGYRDLAVEYAKWLIDIQDEDGSWFDAEGETAYIFDSAQILKGLLAIRQLLPQVDNAIIKGCDWIFSKMTNEGRLVTPSKSAWGSNTDMCDEVVHLYCISPLQEAGRIFGKEEYIRKADKIRHYYLSVYQDKIMNFSLLSHFYAYLMEALLDLGEVDMAKRAMNRVADYQDKSGAVPAYNNVHWVCSTGIFQLALVWFRLGDLDRGKRAFNYACKMQNASGGWFGSYEIEGYHDEKNDYFPDGEISWANKFFLDALYYKNLCEFNYMNDQFLSYIDKNDGRYELIMDIVSEHTATGGSILDIGCGKGRYIKNLFEDIPDRKYYACDLSVEVMKHINIEKVLCKQGSLTCIPWENDTFDFVYCCEALEHAIDIKSAVREIARVTRKGGIIVIIDKSKEKLGALEIEEWEQWFDGEELKAIMENYCTNVEIDKNIGYEKPADGLFYAWKGIVR